MATTEQEVLLKIEAELKTWQGKVGFYYENLVSGVRLQYNEYTPMLAASTIKVPVMAALFQFAEEGSFDLSEEYELREEDKLPSCGALNCMEAGLRLKMIDLINLMIVLSDNTATNILIKKAGMERINRALTDMGYQVLHLERLLFDGAAAKAGLENKVSAYELSDMLKRMYAGSLVSEAASAQMLSILKAQKLNGKIPFRFVSTGVEIAHKTGEDSGITHDFGIVYGKEPFILTCLGNEVDAPLYNRFMQDAAWQLFKAQEA